MEQETSTEVHPIKVHRTTLNAFREDNPNFAQFLEETGRLVIID